MIRQPQKILNRILLAAGAILVLNEMLQRILPKLTRDLWEDEFHHNIWITEVSSFWELRHKILTEFQPFLDYFLRRVFWQPLLGISELSWRTPNLIWGLATAVVAYALIYIGLKREKTLGLTPLTLPLAAFGLTSLWVNASDLIHYSAEGRHYSFILFSSTLLFLGLIAARSSIAFWLGAFCLVNLHFFSWPIVALGIFIAPNILGTRRFSTWGLGVLLFSFAILFSKPSLLSLLNSPPIPRAIPLPWTDWFATGWNTLEQWMKSSRLTLFELGGLATIGIFSSALRTRWLVTLTMGGILLPLLLGFIQSRSDYAITDRYLFPFFGMIGAIWFLAGTSALRIIRPIQTPLLIFGLIFFQYPRLIIQNALTIPNTLHQVQNLPQNFSPYYYAYEEIKKSQHPILLIHSHCWAHDIPLAYLKHIGSRTPVPYEILDSNACHPDLATTHASLKRIFSSNTAMRVVLEQKEKTCNDPNPLTDWTQLSSSRLCITWRDGPIDAKTLAQGISAARFPTHREFIPLKGHP